MICSRLPPRRRRRLGVPFCAAHVAVVVLVSGGRRETNEQQEMQINDFVDVAHAHSTFAGGGSSAYRQTTNKTITYIQTASRMGVVVAVEEGKQGERRSQTMYSTTIAASLARSRFLLLLQILVMYRNTHNIDRGIMLCRSRSLVAGRPLKASHFLPSCPLSSRRRTHSSLRCSSMQ